MWRLLASNAAIRAVTTPIAICAGLLSARASVGYLGAEQYSAVLLVVGLAQLLPFVDMGVGAAVMNAVSPERRAPTTRLADDSTVFRTLVSAQRVLVTSGAGLVALAVFLAVAGWWPTLLGPGAASLPDVTVAAVAFVSVFAATVCLQLGYRVLTGVGRNQLTSVLSASASVFSLALVVAGVHLGAPVLFFVVAPTAASAVAAAVAAVVGGALVGASYVRIWAATPRLDAVRRVPLRSTALPMLVIMVALPAVLFSHRLIVSHVSPPSELVAYTLSSQVYAPAWAAVTGTLMALWPAFVRARASDSGRRALVGTAVVVASAGLLAGAALAWLIPIGTAFIAHGQAVSPPAVAVGFGFMLSAQIAFYPFGVYLTRPVELKFQAVCVVTMLVVGLPACILSAERWGAAGPVWVSGAAILLFQFLPALAYLRIRGFAGEARGAVETMRS